MNHKHTIINIRLWYVVYFLIILELNLLFSCINNTLIKNEVMWKTFPFKYMFKEIR